MPYLNWIGKDKVINHHLDVPFRVLDKSYEYGETNENMIIHGDNLMALKSLLPRFEGRIKCIYIDPPYNTGNEKWVYNDNVNDPKIKKWLGEVVGKESEDLSRHDKWLCMMYPRLKLLRQLLADDGAIFISIDDNEQANLKMICDEIFSKQNFISNFCVKRSGSRQDSKFFAITNEYILCYAKNSQKFVSGKEIKENETYSKFDEIKKRFYKIQLLRKWGANSLRENRPNLFYPIKAPDNSNVYPMIYKGSEEIDSCWRWGRQKMSEALQDDLVEFVKNKGGKWIPYEKIYEPLEGETKTKKFTTWIDNVLVGGADDLKEIFSDAEFDYPKSVDLIMQILTMGNSDKNSIILDSFAGSGTTAHAVLNLNRADGGNRKFILVEMGDYADNITAERVKRVMAQNEISTHTHTHTRTKLARARALATMNLASHCYKMDF